jgi:hypothetical protein
MLKTKSDVTNTRHRLFVFRMHLYIQNVASNGIAIKITLVYLIKNLNFVSLF